MAGCVSDFFVLATFHDLQMAWISDVACPEHVVDDRAACNVSPNVRHFSENMKYPTFSWTWFLRIYISNVACKKACYGRSMFIYFFLLFTLFFPKKYEKIDFCIYVNSFTASLQPDNCDEDPVTTSYLTCGVNDGSQQNSCRWNSAKCAGCVCVYAPRVMK